MNSPSSRLLPEGCLLLLVVATAPRASTFSAPRDFIRTRTSFVPTLRVSELSPVRVGTSGLIVGISTGSSASTSRRETAASSTTRLTAHLACLDSLRDISSNPDLFPTTSDYIRTLSLREDDASDTESVGAAPSAEEFLTQLSTELLRASREQQETMFQPMAAASATAAAVDAATTGNVGNSLLYNLAEQTVPAVASAIGVGFAAETYNPASYSSMSNQMMMADGSNHGVDSGYATEYMTGSYADYTTTATANTVVGNDGGASESFAAWHSQGGSNSLRDLASSIPTMDQQDVSLTAQDTFVGGMNHINDYFGSNGEYYVADNAGLGSSFDASTVVNSYASMSDREIGDTWHSQGGSNALQDLATSIPTDDIIVEQQDVSFKDDILEGMNKVMDQLGNAGGYFSTEKSEVAQLSENNAAGQQAAPMMQNSVLDAATGASSGVELEAGTAMAAVDTAPIEGAAFATANQATITPQVSSDTLSPQLSDMNYNGLQIDGEAAATNAFSLNLPSSPAKPPNTGLLSDSIKEKLDHMELPQYHIELPKVSNPFLEIEPSMQSALTSVKEASGASKVKLDGLFNTMTHSLDVLGDKMTDVSNSIESLSGQMTRVANAGASGVETIGNAVQSGVSSIGGGMASIKGVGAGLHPPNLNIQPLAFPDVSAQVPNLPAPPTLPNVNMPSVNLPQPSFLPNLNIVEGTNAALKRVGDASLTDFGNVVLSAIKFIGGIVVNFLDLILNAVSGTSVASILSNIQTSVTSVIDNANHAVVSTITNIGNLSVKEILQHSMALIIAIADILLKITNAIIYIISGKDGADWALQATSSVNGASSQLLAQATLTYDDVTHASLTEVAHSIGDYSQHVGGEFVTLIGSLNGMDGISLDGAIIPEDTLNSVASAVQTALSL